MKTLSSRYLKPSAMTVIRKIKRKRERAKPMTKTRNHTGCSRNLLRLSVKQETRNRSMGKNIIGVRTTRHGLVTLPQNADWAPHLLRLAPMSRPTKKSLSPHTLRKKIPPTNECSGGLHHYFISFTSSLFTFTPLCNLNPLRINISDDGLLGWITLSTICQAP